MPLATVALPSDDASIAEGERLARVRGCLGCHCDRLQGTVFFDEPGVAKLTAGNLVLALPGLLDAVKNTISTDVPEARLSDLAAAVQEADMSDLERIVLQPPDFVTPSSRPTAGYILIPDLELIRDTVADMLAGRDTDASEAPAADS